MASGEGDKMSEKRVASFLDLVRMCKSFDMCDGCPFVGRSSCRPYDFTEKDNEAVLKWCDKHPAKTYAQDFFEKYPKAKRIREKDGREHPEGICKIKIFGLVKEDVGCLYKTCSTCWNEDMPEVTK